MVVDDTFHLSTIPTLDELDGDTTITAGELNFVASHFDDDLDDFGFDFAFPGAPHLLQNFEIYDDYDDFDDFFDAEDDM